MVRVFMGSCEAGPRMRKEDDELENEWKESVRSSAMVCLG